MRPGPADEPAPDHAPARGARTSSPRVLIVAAATDRREAWTTAMRGVDVVCGLAESLEGALELITTPTRDGSPRYEVVVVDVPACNPGTLRFVRAAGEREVPALIVCPRVSFDEAVEAMRAGACDIISSHAKPRELVRRVRSACAQARSGRATAKDDLSPPAHGFADPSPHKPTSPKRRASPISTPPAPDTRGPVELAEDFARAIREQLDVEALLRHALEFLLAHGGPTNAAVFLPSTSGDYSLGAYVNYTCPKETGEVLLDHLANVAAPKLDSLREPLLLTRPEEITDRIGDGVEWLLENHVLAFACRSENECLALFMLFRDRQSPFSPGTIDLCGRIATAFADQLARVVRIHHRHLPRDKWGSLGDPRDADSDGGHAA